MGSDRFSTPLLCASLDLSFVDARVGTFTVLLGGVGTSSSSELRTICLFCLLAGGGAISSVIGGRRTLPSHCVLQQQAASCELVQAVESDLVP